MGKEDKEFQDGLYSLALEPENIWDFVTFFNQQFDEFNGNKRGQGLLLEDHIDKAIAVNELLLGQEMRKTQSLQNTIEKAIHPVLALDINGHIIQMNDEAAELFKIESQQSYFLNFLSQHSRNQICEVLNRLSRIKNGVRPEFIELMEIEMVVGEASHLVCIAPYELEADRYCLLVQGMEIKWPDYLTPIVRDKFELTETEGEVFRLIAEGTSVNDISKIRKTSIATVRTQVRNLYAKTGVNNQLQFIRLAVSLAALNLDNQPDIIRTATDIKHKQVAQPYPRPEHWKQYNLPDGRRLDYADFGSPNGQPCLFFHNEWMGHIWPAAMAEYATAKGLRIILPARPFYGMSSAYPSGCFHPTQTAKDFTSLLDHLGIDEVAVLAQTLGGMFATQFLHLFPKRVLGLCIISPMLPFTHDDHRRGMPPMSRFVGTILMKSPRLFEFFARNSYAVFLRSEPDRYLQKIFGDLPVDQPIFRHPVHRASLLSGIKFASKGYMGYVAGYRHMLRDAAEKMQAAKIPYHVVIGDSDQNTRVDRAESLISMGVDIRTTMAPGGGELLIYSHSRLIIDTLIQASGIEQVITPPR